MNKKKNEKYFINYKNFSFLKKFLSLNYRINSKNLNSFNKSYQKKISKYIKYIKYLALFPYIYKIKFK